MDKEENENNSEEENEVENNEEGDNSEEKVKEDDEESKDGEDLSENESSEEQSNEDEESEEKEISTSEEIQDTPPLVSRRSKGRPKGSYTYKSPIDGRLIDVYTYRKELREQVLAGKLSPTMRSRLLNGPHEFNPEDRVFNKDLSQNVSRDNLRDPSEPSQNFREDKNKISITPEEVALLKKEIAEEQLKTGSSKESKKKFKWSWNKNKIIKQSAKKREYVLFLLINLKRELEGPILTKLYGGSFIVHRNHVYRYRPDRAYSMGKHKVAIGREFDRELVSMEDYDKVITEGGNRTNRDDPVLIKALIMAKVSDKPSTPVNKWIWIIGGLVLAVGVGYLMFNAPTKATPVTPN